MPFPAQCIANEFLKLAQENNQKLTPMKIQKLVYFAHGWYLALTEQPLISERIEAWQYGPVIPALYREFRAYGNDPITSLLRIENHEGGKIKYAVASLDNCADTEEAEKARSLVARVFEVYGGYSAARLSNSTHMPGTPWSQVYKNGVKSLAIPDEVIKAYFKGLASGNQ